MSDHLSRAQSAFDARDLERAQTHALLSIAESLKVLVELAQKGADRG